MSIQEQFHNEVYEPVAAWAAVQDQRSRLGEIRIDEPEYSDGEVSFSVRADYRAIISVRFQILINVKHEVIKLVREHSPGYPRPARLFQRPGMRGRKLLGWGSIITDLRHGFNLILLGGADSSCGEWRLLRNRNHSDAATALRRDPEPFAFTMAELEQERALIGSLYTYQVTIEDLAIPGHVEELFIIAQ